MKIKIIFIILVLATALIVAPLTAKITVMAKDKEFARVEKVYISTVDKVFNAYETLAEKARYTISQTLTIEKNKKGQIIYVPTSTMEIDKIIEDIEQKIKNPDGSIIIIPDTIKNESKKTFWEKLKFW